MAIAMMLITMMVFIFSPDHCIIAFHLPTLYAQKAKLIRYLLSNRNSNEKQQQQQQQLSGK